MHTLLHSLSCRTKERIKMQTISVWANHVHLWSDIWITNWVTGELLVCFSAGMITDHDNRWRSASFISKHNPDLLAHRQWEQSWRSQQKEFIEAAAQREKRRFIFSVSFSHTAMTSELHDFWTLIHVIRRDRDAGVKHDYSTFQFFIQFYRHFT